MAMSKTIISFSLSREFSLPPPQCLRRPSHRPPLTLMQVAVPRHHQHAVPAECAGRLNIGEAVADPPRLREVDIERRLRVAKQLETGLAAVAGTGELRVMRAEVEIGRASCRERV